MKYVEYEALAHTYDPQTRVCCTVGVKDGVYFARFEGDCSGRDDLRKDLHKLPLKPSRMLSDLAQERKDRQHLHRHTPASLDWLCMEALRRHLSACVPTEADYFQSLCAV